MKTLLLSCFIWLALATQTATDSPVLEIQFNDLKVAEGKIYLQIMRESNEIEKQFTVSVSNKNTKVVIKDLPTGKLAIRAFQDLNGNGKLDIGLFGPKEPYGFSNNARGIIGEPDFSEQLFNFPETKRMVIYLK